MGLYFVDIEGRRGYRWIPGEKKADIIRTEERVGCLVFHRGGGIVTAEGCRLIHRGGAGKKVLIDQNLPEYLRYNDGKCDRFGNLWVGTMAVSQSHPKAANGGSCTVSKTGGS